MAGAGKFIIKAADNIKMALHFWAGDKFIVFPKSGVAHGDMFHPVFYGVEFPEERLRLQTVIGGPDEIIGLDHMQDILYGHLFGSVTPPQNRFIIFLLKFD